MSRWKYAYGYIRVSRPDLNEENQKLAIKQWAKLHGYIIDEWFADTISGAIDPTLRPGFRHLMDRCKYKPKPVIVYDISRLGRSFYEVFVSVKKLEELGAPVISVKEEFLQSMDGSMRNMALAILAWVAEREREMIIERTKAGLLRAKMQGKHIGRPKVKIDIALLKRYYVEMGLPMTIIAKLLNTSYSTIRRRVKELGLKPKGVRK